MRNTTSRVYLGLEGEQRQTSKHSKGDEQRLQDLVSDYGLSRLAGQLTIRLS
jgi:hypothetical protein